MPSIQITINSKHHATVSLVDAPGVISCIVNYRKPSIEEGSEHEFHTSFGGIDNTTGDYLDWDRADLQTGDEVTFKIIQESVAIPKAKRRPLDEDNKSEYSKEDYVRECAKELGWTITEDTKPIKAANKSQ